MTPGGQHGSERALVASLSLHELRRAGGRSAMSEEAFTAEELARVLSAYPIGRVRGARPLLRGSRASPKVVVEAEGGRFLLKRRAAGTDPFHVAVCHWIMIELAERGFCVPEIVGTSDENNSMLQEGRHVYELMAYVEGEPYDSGVEQTGSAGATLGRLHGLLERVCPPFTLREGSFHSSAAVLRRLEAAAEQIERRGGDTRPARALGAAYERAAAGADAAGLSREGWQVVHGDWHPGNALFRERRLLAVVDFDTPTLAPAVIDAAGGAVQYALAPPRPGEDLERWPVGLDMERLGAFAGGYTQEGRRGAWGRMIAPLMVESLVAEAALPVASAGRFGPYEGGAFLGAVERQVRWIEEHGREVEGAWEG